MKKKILFRGILGVMIAGAIASSAFGNDLSYRDARSIGMGDTKIAAGRGGIDFVSNPALLATVKWVSLSAPLLPIYISRDIVDIGEFVSDNQENFENFADLTSEQRDQFLKDIEPFDAKWSRLYLSPMVSVATTFFGTKIGAAVYSCDDIAFKIDRGVFEPSVWGEGVANTVAVVGLARTVPLIPLMKVGVNVKYIDHRTAPLFRIGASEMGDASELLDAVADSVMENSTTHMAADFGVLVNIPLIGADVGASLRNLGYPEYSSVDIGIAKRILANRLLLTADYIDALDRNEENALNKLHFGTEFNLTLIKLRAGLNAGYPSLGVGLNIGIAQVDAAYYTEELSNVPGGNGEERLLAQVRVGF